MSNLILELFGLLGMNWLIMLLILIDLELDIFQKIGKYLVASNIFKIQAYDSIMWGYFCIGFIDFMHVGKTLTDFN